MLILGYAVFQLPEMLISFWGFFKNWRLYMREKIGRIQQTRNSTNALEDSHANGNMVPFQSQEVDKEFRMKRENYESIMSTLEKLGSRLKSLEGHREFTINKQNLVWITERFEKKESRLEHEMQKNDILEN